MGINNVCGNCVHYPLCYVMWHVQATHPCRHIVGGSVGFFRSKKEFAAIPEKSNKDVKQDDGMAEEAQQRIAELEAEIRVSDVLLEDRARLLEAIPECPVHGACVPHAIEWIEQVKTLARIITPGIGYTEGGR